MQIQYYACKIKGALFPKGPGRKGGSFYLCSPWLMPSSPLALLPDPVVAPCSTSSHEALRFLLACISCYPTMGFLGGTLVTSSAASPLSSLVVAMKHSSCTLEEDPVVCDVSEIGQWQNWILSLGLPVRFGALVLKPPPVSLISNPYLLIFGSMWEGENWSGFLLLAVSTFGEDKNHLFFFIFFNLFQDSDGLNKDGSSTS